MSLFALSMTLIFIAFAVFISIWQKLGLERDLFIGTIRAAIQLLVVGYVLQYVFQTNKPFIVIIIIAIMIAVATWNVYRRNKPLQGAAIRIGAALCITEIITVGLLLLLKIIPFTSNYIIPISGMTIGNAMVIASLYLNQMNREITANHGEVETLLALGATARQSIHPILKRSIKASMIPTIDGMKTVGLVQLPGMMTGMILAGTSPLEAVRYQILIVFAFASSAALTSILLSMLTYRLWFTRSDVLKNQKV